MAGRSSAWIMIRYDRETMVEELLNRLRVEGIVPERLTVIRMETESTVRDWRGEGLALTRKAAADDEVAPPWFESVSAWGPLMVAALWLVGSLSGVFPARSVWEALGIALLLGLAGSLIGAVLRHLRPAPHRSIESGGGERSRSNGRVIVAVRLEDREGRPRLENIVLATGGKPLDLGER
jgi:hypothetical protein